MTDAVPLTSKRVLRNNKPLWAASSATSVRTAKSPQARFYDVIVVGAGISGALMAHALCAGGLKVLVIDRRHPVRGSTLASTAMIQHEIDVPLHRLAKMIGREKAQKIWQRSARAVEQLAILASDLDLNCSFERKRTLFLAGDAYGARALRAEVAARTAANIDSAFVDAETLRRSFGMDRTGAIESGISASANPAQMTAGLLRHVRQSGVELVSGLEITDVRSTADQVVLATAAGELIAAQHVVFCTGYEFLTSLQNKSHSLVSTWALASRPHVNRPDWLNSYLVWEGAEPYLYFRSTPDGRIVLGGEDESSENAFEDEAKSSAKAEMLAEKFKALTGIVIGKPDFVWSAAFGTTSTGLPMIGQVPGLTNVFVAMGYGGNGITFSQIAADIISAEILGHHDAAAELFPIR